MKITCDIIQDLLPLYEDDVLSEDSRQLVEEHLAGCEKCRQNLVAGSVSSVAANEISASKPLKKIKKKMFRKNAVIALITAICVLVICSSFVYYVFYDESPIAYDPSKITAKQAVDETIDIYVKGNYDRAHSEIEGNIVYIWLYTTRWSNHNDRYKYDDADLHVFSVSKTTLLNNSNGESQKSKHIKAVYYREPNAKAHLLWEEK